MNASRLSLGMLVALFVLFASFGCSDDKNNPLSAFEPEIINSADAFQFQISDAENVTTTVTYDWSNAGTQATINHSTVTGSGTATVHVFDADSTEVYSSGLAASLNETSSTGTAGVWQVRVVFVGYSGTANFRVEKL